MKTSIAYLDHIIEVELADPSVDNTIYVTLHRAEGTYDADLYNAYLDSYQFSATSDDPNQWLAEAIASASVQLGHFGFKYYEPPTRTSTVVDCIDIF